MRQDVHDLLPGEQIIWQGRPDWRNLACDLIHIRWIALYLAGYLIWGAYDDRSAGLSPLAALTAGLPLFLLSLALLGVCAAFAWGIARTTRYTITDQRCILAFGLALTATLSLPLHRIAEISVSRPDATTGDIPLTLKPGRKLAFLKLWPHARPWRFAQPQPMLRGVPHAAQVAALLATATAGISPGRMAAIEEASAVAKRPLRPVEAT